MAFTSYDDVLGAVNFTDADPSGPGAFNLTTGKAGRQSFLGQILRGNDANLGGGEFVFAAVSGSNNAGATISSITTASGVATVTTGSAHGLIPGARVILSGQTPAAYSGTWTVLSTPSTTTFTFTHGTTTLGASTVQGTYVVGPVQPSQLCNITHTLTGGAMVATAAPYAGTANTGQAVGVSLVGLLAGQFGWIQIQGYGIISTAGAPASGGAVYCGTTGAVTPTAAAGKQVIGMTYAAPVSSVIGSGSQAQILTSTQAVVFMNRPTVQTQIT